MDIDVIEEKENPLLGRKELKVRVVHEGPAPSRAELKRRLEAKLNAKKGRLIVDAIRTGFGLRETHAFVKVYDSEERARSVEPAYILEKNKPPEEPAGDKEAPAGKEEGEAKSGEEGKEEEKPAEAEESAEEAKEGD
ncbi:MAG: 30S ribosomal protein S24e [Euryarchaeota archaeon]|nr:30S ribosomal protein S24e [Euryarchaeota archaeon]